MDFSALSAVVSSWSSLLELFAAFWAIVSAFLF